MSARVVAIVGRPNVGKSSVFNRLAGRRVSIVHPESGVTRDRIMREITYDRERMEIIDTGGVGNMETARSVDEIDAAVRSQVEAAVADAAVVLLVVDVTAGLVPMDREVASFLRAGGRRTIVVANKADNDERDMGAADFEALGFPVFAVSALHGRGFDALMPVVLKALPPDAESSSPSAMRVAVIGRPNVGKSSYVNKMLKEARVIVLDEPGTTRDSIDVPFVVGKGNLARHYVLIDTAGLRKKSKVDTSVEFYSQSRAERSLATADVVVLVLDAERGATAQDRRIAALILEHKKGCVILVNKWDLAKVTQHRFAPEVSHELPFMGHCPMVFVSSMTGYNIRQSLQAIDQVAARLEMVLPTGVLNRTFMDAYERVQPPVVSGKRLKLFYATQVDTKPPRIRVFVNDPARVTDAYRAYLVQNVRRRFGLEGSPVVLQFVARRDGSGKNS